MALKIAINTRLLLKGKLEGIGNFTFETFKRLAEQHPEIEFHYIFDRPFDPTFITSPNIYPHVIPLPTRLPILFTIWFEFLLPRLLKKIKADLFIGPDSFISLNTNTPSILVLHDLNFVHRPNDIPKKWSKYYNKLVPKFVQKAARIATVSEYSKSDIHQVYKTDLDKIDVVFNGAKSLFQKATAQDIQTVKQTFKIHNDYFFYVGSLHPRKNLINLIKAFGIYKKENANEVQLVIAGDFLWNFDQIKTLLESLQLEDQIIFTGRISDAHLNALLSGAIALTYVPFFEGFGIPIIEAFEAETAVITSNTTSMPEVAGNAGVLVDPNNINEIASAMQKVSSNPTLRAELIELGMKQKKQFSWERTADLMWLSIEKTLKENGIKKL